MPIARLDKVSLSFGRKPLLDNIALQIRKGERVCLLGRNGEGKSSLLQVIAGQIVPDSGEVWIRPGIKIASLAQEACPSSDGTVLEILRQGVAAKGADVDWQAHLNVDQIISRLKLDGDAPLRALSGGWRRRVMLGRALVSAPGLLLLDEPTNHLDIDAITWLEDAMMDFDGALLFVSHDRTFVRRLATRIIELDRGQLNGWPSNYDEYVLRKRAALEVETTHAALFDKKLAQEEAWIRQGVEARRTRNEGRVRALEALRVKRRERREPIGRVELTAQEATPSGQLVFEARGVKFHFGVAEKDTPPVIDDFWVRIMRGDRIGIVGPNGCGKTTLIKLLIGELEPTEGSFYRGTSLKPAYFDQQREQLDPTASLMENVTNGSGETVMIGGRARHVSGYLRDFLFPPERLRAPVNMLSGGERNRLLLARLLAKPNNLLVLDEPTNDLDAETLDLLEEMLAGYAGTLLLVSHDRAFLDNVVTSTLVFEGRGSISEYVGGYSDWLRQRRPAPLEAAREPARKAPTAKALTAKASSSEVPARSKSSRRSYNEQRELDQLPGRIQLLEDEQAAVQATLADPYLFRDSPMEARAALDRLRSLSLELAAAYARWEALESSE
jgi:ATP-binding cassette subfamily F protein uup